MERKDITKILGDDIESDKISELLNLFHKEKDESKEKFDAEKQRAINAEKELKTANEKIADLEKTADSLTEKDKEIAGYLNEIADLKSQNRLTQIDSYETVKLMEAGAFDIDLCKKALDYDRTEIKSEDDYSVIDEAIKSQIQDRNFLFKSAESEKPKETKEDDSDKKKPAYKPRSGNSSGEKKGDSLGTKMAKEIMSGNYLGIS